MVPPCRSKCAVIGWVSGRSFNDTARKVRVIGSSLVTSGGRVGASMVAPRAHPINERKSLGSEATLLPPRRGADRKQRAARRLQHEVLRGDAALPLGAIAQ